MQPIVDSLLALGKSVQFEGGVVGLLSPSSTYHRIYFPPLPQLYLKPKFIPSPSAGIGTIQYLVFAVKLIDELKVNSKLDPPYDIDPIDVCPSKVFGTSDSLSE